MDAKKKFAKLARELDFYLGKIDSTGTMLIGLAAVKVKNKQLTLKVANKYGRLVSDVKKTYEKMMKVYFAQQTERLAGGLR